MLNIEEPNDYKVALHHLGFRPFFLGATIFSVISVFIWFWLYQIDANRLLHITINATSWHAHEMIFGYTFAVIAGFLLTAVRNWTNVQTIHGIPLLLLSLLWLGARVSPFLPFSGALALMAFLDIAFNFLLVIAIASPVIKVQQWRQLGIIVIVMLLGMMNGIFYLGAYDRFTDGIQAGIYGGLYSCLFLILIMGRRVIPFFIEKGVDEDVTLVNRNWLDISSISLMFVFITSEVFLHLTTWASFCALMLFVLQAIRLYDWYTSGIWKKSLLWSLYLAYLLVTLGFGLKAAELELSISPMLTTHAFAYGGIGLMTLSMMSRVTLGHTGRNVFQPPTILRWIFIIFVLGIITRVILPIFLLDYYRVLIGISQLLWIVAFTGFIFVFVPKLIQPRVDGRYG